MLPDPKEDTMKPRTEMVAQHALDAINADAKAGRFDPAEVATFADLHDHVDANEYLIQATEAVMGRPWTTEDVDLCNAASDVLADLHVCATCDALVGDDHPPEWMLADGTWSHDDPEGTLIGPCSWLIDLGLRPEPDSPSDRIIVECGAPTRVWGAGWRCDNGHAHAGIEVELAPGGPEWQREQRDRAEGGW